MRICIVTSIHPSYDARIWRYCTTLAEGGVDVDLIAPWVIDPGKSNPRVRIHPFVLPQSRSRRVLVAWISILRSLITLRSRIELVHFHDLDCLPLMALVSLFKPVVYDVHENYPMEMLSKEYLPSWIRPTMSFLVRIMQRILSQVIRNVVLVSPSQLADFRSRRLNILYVYNYASRAFGHDNRLCISKRSDVVVFTGSGYVSNGIELLLDIAFETVKRRPATKFSVADRFSSKEVRERFVRKRRELGLDEKLSLFSHVAPQDLPSVLLNCAVAVAPSLAVPKQLAAIPTKLFEYMAVGLPVVAGPLPYQRSIIVQHKVGLIAETASAEEYAEKICVLLDDLDLNRELTRNAVSAFHGSYCFESQLTSILDYYNNILKGV